MEIFSGYGRRGVVLHEYNNAPATDQKDDNECIGYVEPVGKKPAWILYFTSKGDAIFYSKRGPTGGVQGLPVRVKAHTADKHKVFGEQYNTSSKLFKHALPSADKRRIKVWCIGPDQTEYYAAHDLIELVNFYDDLVGTEQMKEDFDAHCEEVPQSALDVPFDFDDDGHKVKTTWREQIEKVRLQVPCQISTGYN